MSGRIPRYKHDLKGNSPEISSHKHDLGFSQSASERSDPGRRSLHPKTGLSMEDEAESTLLAVLEERRARAISEDVGWVGAIQGERPPLHNVPVGEEARTGLSTEAATTATTEKAQSEKDKMWFSSLARRARSLNRNGRQSQLGKNRKDVFEAVAVAGHGGSSRDDTDAGRLISSAMKLDDLFVDRNDETLSAMSEESEAMWADRIDEEVLPLTGIQQQSDRDGYMSTPRVGSDAENRTTNQPRRRVRRCQRWLRKVFCAKSGYWLLEVLHPKIIWNAFVSFVFRSLFTKTGMPCLVAAALLFYKLDNPKMDFMPQATLSWFLVFIARQTLTLQLALITEYIVVDTLAMRNRLMVHLFGPLVTLFLLNSKGWPCLAVFWGLWDMFLLHGGKFFQQNWLYFTGIELFSSLNYGGHIIKHAFYYRILVTLLIAGGATSVKRSVVALYFGRKTFTTYKVRLEKLLADIILIAEVAELSSHLEMGKTVIDSVQTDTKWTSMRFPGNPLDAGGDPKYPTEYAGNEDADDDDSEGIQQKSGGDRMGQFVAEGHAITEALFAGKDRSNEVDVSKSVGRLSTRQMKNLLERWTEPTTKDHASAHVSISDILKFRKALTFMDDVHPFSLSFGPARTRDEGIRSAQKTYERLMKYQRGNGILSFDVIGLLSYASDTEQNLDKEASLRVLFRPDQFNELSAVAFVQACDTVYKRLRFFRASVGNSSVIDRVLEKMIDGVFYFILVLVLLIILEFNPWPLLVSVSTMAVSFAFAFGSSASKYIEGVLLIVGRRPYDLGDRIMLVDSVNVQNFDTSYSWFVEDINLFSTTLRFATTNHVATVNNGAIANARIVNCARSLNAVITLDFRLGYSIPVEKIDVFRESIEKYMQDNPRLWDQLLVFECRMIDPDMGIMDYTLRARHTKPWQDAPVINTSVSDLNRFCHQVGQKLGVMFETPARTQVVVLQDATAVSAVGNP